jgi:hypothetical protein
MQQVIVAVPCRRRRDRRDHPTTARTIVDGTGIRAQGAPHTFTTITLFAMVGQRRRPVAIEIAGADWTIEDARGCRGLSCLCDLVLLACLLCRLRSLMGAPVETAAPVSVQWPTP